jgi:hypothetical protein
MYLVIDHSGQNIAPGHIHDARIRWCSDFAAATLNPATFDQQVAFRNAAFVHQFCVLDHDPVWHDVLVFLQ